MRIIFLASLILSASAFIAPSSPAFASNGKSRVASAVFATDNVDEADTGVAFSVGASVDIAKDELMDLTRDFKEKYGVLLIDSKAKESFRKAVEKLESVAELPTDTSLLVGDWTLLSSSSSSSATAKIEIDTNKIPFFNEGPIRDIKNTLNNSIKVQQLIKFGETANSIDTIDHVIDYTPPNQLSSFLKNIPDAIKDLDINPLKVSDTKVVLKHKAEVEGVIPVIKIKLSLEAVILNVAGESKNLEPTGEDVLGINIPFGEFLNAGSFDTTFVDDSMRISRSKVGPVDQIRVFVKTNDDQKAVTASVVDDKVVDDDDDDDELADDNEVDGAIDAVVVVDEEKETTAEDDDDDDDDDDEIVAEAPSDIEN